MCAGVRYAPPSSRQYAEASPQTLETPCSLAGVEMFTVFWPVQESRGGEGGEEVPGTKRLSHSRGRVRDALRTVVAPRYIMSAWPAQRGIYGHTDP